MNLVDPAARLAFIQLAMTGLQARMKVMGMPTGKGPVSLGLRQLVGHKAFQCIVGNNSLLRSPDCDEKMMGGTANVLQRVRTQRCTV